MSVVNIQLVGSIRFMLIGFMYMVTLGNLDYTPYNKMDFGILPLNCHFEGAVSYMLMIINIHWNFCWSYDLYLSIKKPMSYSEHFFSFY